MMTTPDAPFGWRRGSVLGLALLSLVIPVIAVFVRTEPLVPFTDPARLSYYRQAAVALGPGLVCALVACAGARTMPASGVRRLSMALAIGGILLSLYLGLTLIGTCGTQILAGSCRP